MFYYYVVISYYYAVVFCIPLSYIIVYFIILYYLKCYYKQHRRSVSAYLRTYTTHALMTVPIEGPIIHPIEGQAHITVPI
jgi:hypothetical protein